MRSIQKLFQKHTQIKALWFNNPGGCITREGSRYQKLAENFLDLTGRIQSKEWHLLTCQHLAKVFNHANFSGWESLQPYLDSYEDSHYKVCFIE